MIQHWGICHDTPTEDGDSSSCDTEIEAFSPQNPGESLEDWIARAKWEAIAYRDPNGYILSYGQPHPENARRLSQNLRPLFLHSYTPEEDPKVPGFQKIKVTWKTDTVVEGVNLERVPPSRIQHTLLRPALIDPNTKKYHTTTAGELIRGRMKEVAYMGYKYSLRMPRLPPWYTTAAGRPVNKDVVVLDGDRYQPDQCWCHECTAEPFRVRANLYYWQIDLTILIDPEGWFDFQPNVGHYEQILVAETIPQTPEEKPRSVDIMSAILNERDLVRYYDAARTGRAIRLGAGTQPVRVRFSYVPIRTWLKKPMYGKIPEITEVDKPVPIHKSGMAFRYLEDGSPLKTTDFAPEDLHILKLADEKREPFSPWGL